MKKTTLFKEYSLDEARYKRYCSIIGVDSAAADFPAAMVADFEFVVGLFNEQKNLQDEEASARYAEFKSIPVPSMPAMADVSESIATAVEGFRPVIKQEVSSLVGDVEASFDAFRRQCLYSFNAALAEEFILESQRRSAQRRSAQTAYPVFAIEDQMALPEGQDGND